MPLDRLVLILVIAMAAAGLTVLVGVFVVAAADVPFAALAGAVPVMLLGYVVWRVIADRLRERGGYDRTPR